MLNEYNSTGTRMGWQDTNDDAFLNSNGNYSNYGLAIFEQIFDFQSKGFYT